MNNVASSFDEQSDDRESTAYLRKVLDSYRGALKAWRAIFLYGMRLYDFTKENITDCEDELRDIIAGLDNLRKDGNVYSFITSIDGLIEAIQKIRRNLFIASKILAKKATIKESDLFSQLLRECPRLFDDAIDCFLVE